MSYAFDKSWFVQTQDGLVVKCFSFEDAENVKLHHELHRSGRCCILKMPNVEFCGLSLEDAKVADELLKEVSK